MAERKSIEKEQLEAPQPPPRVPEERRHVQYANSVEASSNPNETHILFQIHSPDMKPLSGTQVIIPTAIVKSFALVLLKAVLETEKQIGQTFPAPPELSAVAEDIAKAAKSK